MQWLGLDSGLIPSAHPGGEIGKVIPTAIEDDPSTSSHSGRSGHQILSSRARPSCPRRRIGKGCRWSETRDRGSRRYCDEIAGFPAWRTPSSPVKRPEMGILLRDGRSPHAGDYAIENTILDLARRRPRGIRGRRAFRSSCGADGCRPVGEEGRSRQIGGMVSIRRAQRRRV